MPEGKFLYYTATTMDGFIADENHSLQWLFDVPTQGSTFEAFFNGLGAFVMGRNTFDWVVEHERLYEHPEKWKQYHGELPCWVFTNRPLKPIPGAAIEAVSGDVKTASTDILKSANGKDVWLAGGGELVGTFLDQGLLDELILQFAPVILGKGAPLLPRRLLSADLELMEAKQNGQFIDARYRLRRSQK